MASSSIRSKTYTTISARVIHADGTVTDHGVISTNMPWFKRFLRKVKGHG